MFDTLGRYSTFLYRLLFANIRVVAPLLDIYTRLTGGEINATVRTTTAFTMMEGSKGVNVIPPVAKMMSNHRLAPGDTQESILAEIKKVCEDEHVKVERLEGMDPSRISAIDGEAYERVCDVIHKTWPEAIVSPYPMVACSDSRHWGRISDKVYRFSAMALSKEERGTIHGNDERIPLATIAKTVEFYIRLIKKS
jgi:carboxypeptidase PM20D1